ncbi:MAG: phytoene desaturase family protein [Planctomycetota bacterium]
MPAHLANRIDADPQAAQPTENPKNVVVVGGGLGGLAAACTLAGRGHKVTLVEANPWVGGKAAQLWGDPSTGESWETSYEPAAQARRGDPSAPRYRFDMGPTILTVPRVLKRIFGEAGQAIEDHLELINLDPQWRCFFDYGGVLDLRQRVDDMRQELERFAGPGTPADLADRYAGFIQYAERLHRISDQFFFWKSVGGLKDIFELGNSFDAGTLGDVLAMRMGRSVASTIRKHVPEPRVAQMLDHFTQYVGSSPYGSPAILCSIASMQVHEGVWYPKGGTRAVPEALAKLAESLGVTFRTNSPVERIGLENGKVTGVELASGERLTADCVVSNADAIRTQHELLNGEDTGGKQQPGDREPACSGVVLYLGLKKRYEHLAHHGFVFSKDPEQEFHHIYELGEPAPDPTCYLAATARTEPETTPPGGEALYVLVHTPYLHAHHNWARTGELYTTYRKTILNKLERTAGLEGLEDNIAFERALTPQDIHDRYRVLNGAIYGLASHGTFTGAFKPANRSPLAKGLYLAGGSAHPGAGMPMALMSGWIAADSLDQDANKS